MLAAGGLAHAAALEGHILNGTSNNPVAGVKVELLQIQQAMTPVASATTDAQGLFRVEGMEAFSGSPLLLQAEYQGANYTQPLMAPQAMPGGPQIRVYDASKDKSILALKEHAIFVRPSGGVLSVIEQISVLNNSNPPRTYVNPAGTYLFSLPGKPREPLQASIVGTAGMPVPQTPSELKKPNSFAITYPIRPGESQIRLEYALDYQAPFRFSKPLDQPAEQTHIVTPGEGVQVAGDSLTPVGKEPTTGLTAYQLTAGAKAIEAQVTGEAPATQAETQTAESSESAGGLIEIPDGATERRWLILGTLGVIMLAGFALLYARPN
jgi:hypothetical protein